MASACFPYPPVRALRPKPLEQKLAAVAAASLMSNLPLGAWREHTRKFSFEWFVAVHASIPFVVSLRKAAGDRSTLCRLHTTTRYLNSLRSCKSRSLYFT